jgi:HPt (histidine-containing phosphotransfer) domain-containing protein
MPAIDRIDTDEAIARLGGNEKLYAEVLESYLSELQGQSDQLDALLKKGDRAGAGRLLHTFKGLSATVGATYLAAVTKAAELAIKNNVPSVELTPLCEAFRSTAERTRHLLSPLAHGPGPAVPSAPVATVKPLAPQERDSVQRALAELHALLLSSDLGALEMHSALQAKTAVVAMEGFDSLSQSIASFDFANAALRCQELMLALDRRQNGL